MVNESGRPDDEAFDKDRRRVLKALGALGVTGLAGCGGDGDDTDTETEPEDTATATATDTDETGDDVVFEISSLSVEPESPISAGESITVTAEITNTGEDTGSRTVEYRLEGDVAAEQDLELEGFGSDTVTFEDVDTSGLEPGESYEHGVYTDDDEQTATLEIQALPDLTDPLLSLNEESFTSGEIQLTGTISNAYLFSVVDGEVTLDVPDAWEIVEESGTSFDELEGASSQDVSWTLSVPDGASGEFDLTATVTYSDGVQDPVELTVDHTVTVIESISAPFGLNCGGFYDEDAGGAVVDTRTIDGVEFESYLEDEAPNPYVQLISTHNNSGSNDAGQSIEGVEGERESLYQTMMWSDTQFGYEILIEPGTYEVIFHLAEIHYGAAGGEPPEDPGERIYTGTVNGETVFEEFAPYTDPGPLVAQTYSTEVEVQGDPIVIEMESSQENPMINALEIREA